MRKMLGALGMAALVACMVPGSAPAVPTAASVRCLQISPSNTPGSCTYKATIFRREVLTAFTLQGYTIDWVENGRQLHYACTAGACRNEPGRSFTADPGTTIHITVTKGVVVVGQVAVGGA